MSRPTTPSPLREVISAEDLFRSETCEGWKPEDFYIDKVYFIDGDEEDTEEYPPVLVEGKCKVCESEWYRVTLSPTETTKPVVYTCRPCGTYYLIRAHFQIDEFGDIRPLPFDVGTSRLEKFAKGFYKDLCNSTDNFRRHPIVVLVF